MLRVANSSKIGFNPVAADGTSVSFVFVPGPAPPPTTGTVVTGDFPDEVCVLATFEVGGDADELLTFQGDDTVPLGEVVRFNDGDPVALNEEMGLDDGASLAFNDGEIVVVFNE